MVRGASDVGTGRDTDVDGDDAGRAAYKLPGGANVDFTGNDDDDFVGANNAYSGKWAFGRTLHRGCADELGRVRGSGPSVNEIGVYEINDEANVKKALVKLY